MNTNYPIVFFDLETTGPTEDAQIIQIGAISGSKSFNAYILPKCEWGPGVSEKTGFDLCNNRLRFNSHPVPTREANIAMKDFIQFLKDFGSKVVLAAHDGSCLDFPKIIQLARQFNMMKDFLSAVYGFVDTFKLLKSKFPSQKKLSLKTLAEKYLAESYDEKTAHNALIDATVLEKICCACINLSKNEIFKHVITVGDFQQRHI